MFSKNAVVTLALVPLAVLTLFPHVAYASPVGPDLQVRGDLPPALRRDGDGLDKMQKRGKGGSSKEHGKDTKKSRRDYDYVAVEKRGGKGGKKGKNTDSKGKKNGRDYDLAARGNGDGRGTEHKDGKDPKNHKSGKDDKTKTKTKSGKD
ncbi:hypothetical protein V8D89_005720 [Ganoderma adspersum]